jgi:hypothetical protein
MTRKKIGLIAAPLIVAVAIVGIVMNQDDIKTSTATEIPFHQVTKTEKPTTTFSVDAQGTVSNNDTPVTPSDEAMIVDPGSSETPAAPQAIFSASSDQYPGAGTFDLPNFSPTEDWTVNFNYTCSVGRVFATVMSGASSVNMQGASAGPFSSRTGHIRIVVPEEADAQNCTWSISVS